MTRYLTLLLPFVVSAHCPDERETHTIEATKVAWLEVGEVFTRWTERESTIIGELDDTTLATRRLVRLESAIARWQELREAFEAAVELHETGTSNAAAMIQIVGIARQMLAELEQ